MRVRERVVKDEEIKPRQKHFQKTWVTWKRTHKQSAKERNCQEALTVKKGKLRHYLQLFKVYWSKYTVITASYISSDQRLVESLPAKLPSHGLVSLTLSLSQVVGRRGAGTPGIKVPLVVFTGVRRHRVVPGGAFIEPCRKGREATSDWLSGGWHRDLGGGRCLLQLWGAFASRHGWRPIMLLKLHSTQGTTAVPE